MAVQPIQITPSALAPNVKTTIYTVPAGARVRIDYCAWCNLDLANTVQFSIWLGPPGSSQRILNKTVLQGETYLCPEVIGALLIAGDIIQIEASAANDLYGQINGVIFT